MLFIFFLLSLFGTSTGPKDASDETSSWEEYEKLKKEKAESCPDSKCPKEKPPPKAYDPEEEFTL